MIEFVESIKFVEFVESIELVELVEFMKVVRFADLEAWKEARALVSQVYKMVRATKDLKRFALE